MALKEGVFAEPASCASIAGFKTFEKRVFFRQGRFRSIFDRLHPDGHGLKDLTGLSAPSRSQGRKTRMKAILAEIGY
jgi:hypothetical protein